MTIQKTWDFATVRDKAKDCILSIDAANIGKAATVTAEFKKGYAIGNYDKWCNLDSYGSKDRHVVYKVYTTTGVSDSELERVETSKVEEQFLALLKLRKLTEENYKGKMISVRTVQAIVETMIQFILARYTLWVDVKNEKSIILYNAGSVSYASTSYNADIVDFSDTLTQEGYETVLTSVFSSALNSMVVHRPVLVSSYTSSSSSSCSSSSCSSSCSSSSCSSSCSSSSCSSSCSTTFIAYLNLSGQF